MSTPDGSRPELVVRVNDVAWLLIGDLGTAGPADQVYTLRRREDGTAWVGFGDGTHGARVPTGTENIVATYRVGLGAAGAVGAGRIIQLPRRPLGVRDVVNPGPAAGWSAPETMDQARVHAPRRVSILDRAVSAADHARFAGGFPGIGSARVDQVWDGRQQRMVVSVRLTDRTDPDPVLLDRLHAALDAVRDPVLPLDVLAGDVREFTVTAHLRIDPRWPWDRVTAGVNAALSAVYGPWLLPFAGEVFSTAVLATIEAVPGVIACDLPHLGTTDQAGYRLTARPATVSGSTPRPAQILVLADAPAVLQPEVT